MGIREVQQAVREFHDAFDLGHGDERAPAVRNAELRIELIREEFEKEFIPAVEAGDVVAATDAILDLVFVAVGAAVEFGVDLEPCWQEVVRTNMAKRGGHKRADGKWIKPPDWQPPNIAALLEAQKGRG